MPHGQFGEDVFIYLLQGLSDLLVVFVDAFVPIDFGFEGRRRTLCRCNLAFQGAHFLGPFVGAVILRLPRLFLLREAVDTRGENDNFH